jgi:hypothetical protein
MSAGPATHSVAMPEDLIRPEPEPRFSPALLAEVVEVVKQWARERRDAQVTPPVRTVEPDAPQ